MGGIYIFNGRRAGRVYRKIADAYKKKELVFSRDKTFLPDEKIPKHVERGSADHALYLFTIAPMTKREVSSNVMNRFRWYCEEHPDFLTISNILRSNVGEVSGILKDGIRAGFYEERAKAIMHNFAILHKDYNGDARNIFGHKPIRKEIKELEKFREYANKTASMLALWFHKYGLSDIKDPENLLPAIDIHKIRINRMTNVIDFELGKRIRDSLVPDLAEKISDFCKATEKTANPVKIRALDEALWILGSEVCVKMDASACHYNCPIDDLCSKEFIIEHYETCQFESATMRNQGQQFFDF